MNDPKVTKTDLKHWLIGYLTGAWPKTFDEASFEKLMKDGEKAKKKASEIMEFLEYTNCINPEINE